MCLFGSKDSTSTQTTGLDSQAEAAKSLALGKATGLANKSYTPTPTDQRVAGFSSDQLSAFNTARSYATGYDPTNVNTATSWAKAFGQAPAQTVGTNTVGANTIAGTAPITAQQTGPAQQIKVEGLMDETGRLGTIASGMDPYLAQVLAPALRNISEQGAQQRLGIKAGATAAGAFGDARHGIVEGAQMRDQGQLVADTTGQAYSAAYGDTMARREADRQAFANESVYNAGAKTQKDQFDTGLRSQADVYNADADRTTQQFNSGVKTAADTYNANAKSQSELTNANFAESALARLLQGGESLMNMEGASELMKSNRVQALLAAGNQQQAQVQKQWDAQQEEKLRAEESQYRQLDSLLAFLNGTPTAQTVTTTSNDGGNGLTKLAAGAIGAFL